MGFKDLKLLISGAINAHSYGSGNGNTRISISLDIDQLKTIRALLDRGKYSATCTTLRYAVESERETGSVQIYPESALELYEGKTDDLNKKCYSWKGTEE